MKLRRSSPSALLVIASLLASSTPCAAGPFSKIAHIFDLYERQPAEFGNSNNATLQERDCANPCGYYGQLCCSTGYTCITDSNSQAQCQPGSGAQPAAATAAAAGSGSGSWQVYTSTWVETGLVTKTATYSSWVPMVTTTGNSQNCVPKLNLNQSPCGKICCESGFWCYAPEQCLAAGNGVFTSTGIGPGLVPARPTTISGVIVTATISPTTTMAYQTPIGTGGANGTIIATQPGHGLSKGAIAGIVIGVLAAVFILFLICLCCCLRAGFEGLMALFGLGPKRKRRERRVVEEEVVTRHSRHGSRDSRRWHGSDSYSRPSRRSSSRKKTGGLLAGGLGLGALAALFAMGKAKKDRREKSDYSSNYSYTDSGYMYSGSSSADSRTRRSSRR